MRLQNLVENNTVLLSGITEFNETFVLDCCKGSLGSETAGAKRAEILQRLLNVVFQMSI